MNASSWCPTLVLGLALATGPGAAHSATVYRCTGDDGRTVLSDRPCGASAVEQFECTAQDGSRVFDEHGCAPPPDRLAAARLIARDAAATGRQWWPYALPALFLLLLWQAPPTRRWRRRRRIRRSLRRGLDRKRYRLYWPPPAGAAVTPADALIVSVHGVFQLRILDLGGQIEGREFGDHWALRRRLRRREIENPLLALDRGQYATADALGINRPQVHSLVVLASGRFAGERPPRVVQPDELVGAIGNFRERLLDEAQVAAVQEILAR